MTIEIACGCGRKLKVKDELAGRRVRCPGCQEVLTVPALAGEGDDEASRLLLAEGPPPVRPSSSPAPVAAGPPPVPASRPAAWDEPPPSAPPRRRRAESSSDEDERPRKRKRSRDEGGGYSGISVHPAIITGILMMVGAVVWFVLGLMADRIFFYPPILFVLGIVSIVKGFTGKE